MVHHQRMVLGELLGYAAAVQVDARVADVGHAEAVLVKHGRAQRGAHALVLGAGVAGLVDHGVGQLHGEAELVGLQGELVVVRAGL